MGFKRRGEPGSIEDEREALRQQRLSLDELKRQLVERVQAVQDRERELQAAIAQTRRGSPGAPSPAGRAPDEPEIAARATALDRRERELAAREAALEEVPEVAASGNEDRERELEQQEVGLHARAAELDQRAAELAAREQALADRDAQPAEAPDAVRLARIEARLAELKEMERVFLRTRDELAARSEAVAARERLVAQRERELDEREDAGTMPGREMGELEARLRALEQRQHDPAEQTQGFADGFRRLRQQGTRARRPAG